METMLKVTNLSKNFGGVKAVNDLSLMVNKGEICAIIGPNGSGKTTSINLITGVLTPDSGDIQYNGYSINNMSRHERAKHGITRTFQNLRIFSTLSILDHVMVGCYPRSDSSFLSCTFLSRAARAEEKANRAKSFDLLRLVGLEGKEHLAAKSLSYGQRRQLEIARALATEPKLLFLDEPAAGMSSSEINNLIDLIFQIREMGVTVVFIEHRMPVVMTAADKIAVLNYGSCIAQGTADEIQANPLVIEAYLGTAYKRELA